MKLVRKIISNNPRGYAEVRNFTGIEPDRYLYKSDFFSFGVKVWYKISGVGYSQFFKGLYYRPFTQNDTFHFFNSINLGAGSWKVTFETILPRLGNTPQWLYSYAVQKLASDTCTEIIALSECAYENQINYIKLNYPQFLEAIKTKMKVVLPPQPPLINDYNEKKIQNTKLVFTLVGADFFRKGGREVLTVFEELLPDYTNLQLNIVSSLGYGDYASLTTIDDFNTAITIINKFPLNITHYKYLPNIEVLELFKKSHVGLLPTWADSFGYSVLEAQASGCAVITTNIRALPEINNEDVGWIIKVPKKHNGDALIDNKEDREEFSKILKNELKKVVLEIIHFPEQSNKKGAKALAQIKINNNHK